MPTGTMSATKASSVETRRKRRSQPPQSQSGKSQLGKSQLVAPARAPGGGFGPGVPRFPGLLLTPPARFFVELVVPAGHGQVVHRHPP